MGSPVPVPMTSVAARSLGVQRGESAWFTRLRVAERHVGVVIALVLVPVSWPLATLFAISYVVRMFAAEGIYHRYTETERDPHSPVAHSFWYAHVGWYVDPQYADTHLDAVGDFARFPELR